MFLMEIRHQPHWRREADRAADYYDGNQLSPETVDKLKERGQPPLISNLIKPTVDTVLGMEAKYSAMAGTQRTTPKGQALSGTHQESYWHSDPFKRGEYASTDDLAEDILAEVLNCLAPHKEFLLSLYAQSARLHLQVASFGMRNYAFELPPELLAQCASLGLSFVHDVYPCAQGI